jgi:iron complex transport system ATP-binding protein
VASGIRWKAHGLRREGRREKTMFLQVDQVTFAYEQPALPKRAREGGRAVLDNVSLGIERGSFTGLLGPNGCGKTTLLKVASGVLRPARGVVRLDGRAIDTIPRRELARHVAVVPQETHPAFDYTVLEMVLMGRHPHLGSFQLEGPHDLEVAREALVATGTSHLADRSYMTLSGGEKQRVVIASALAQEPEVLFLDEPTASLDLRYQLDIASLLARLNRDRNVTMVLATHDLNLAASLCERLVVMRDGRILTAGPTREVLTGETVRQLYDVDADVQFHQRAGHLTVVPVRKMP